MAVKPLSETSSPDCTLLTPHGVCKRWDKKVSVRTLARWRELQEGPPYIRLGKKFLYPLDTLIIYENEHRSNGK